MLLCVQFYVNFVFKRVLWDSKNSEIKSTIWIEHLQSNDLLPLFLLQLGLHFLGQTFGILLFCEYLINGNKYGKLYYYQQIETYMYVLLAYVN